MENKSDYMLVITQLEQIKEYVKVCESNDVSFDFTKVSNYLGHACGVLYKTARKIDKAGCNNG